MVTAWLPGPWRFPYSVPQEGLRLSRWVVSSLSTSAWDAARARGHACKYLHGKVSHALPLLSLPELQSRTATPYSARMGRVLAIKSGWKGALSSNSETKSLVQAATILLWRLGMVTNTSAFQKTPKTAFPLGPKTKFIIHSMYLLCSIC